MKRTIQKQNIEDRERFASNIDNKGRLIRAAGAIVIGATAILVWSASATAGACLALASAFLGFEAARGWCATRACGVKTKF